MIFTIYDFLYPGIASKFYEVKLNYFSRFMVILTYMIIDTDIRLFDVTIKDNVANMR